MSAVFSRRPWGRNECVTNEPQRTSVGRLTRGLLSMLHSDSLSYYLAICYSPLVVKSAGFENLNNGG